jgi:hypothetical protein
VCGFSFRFGIGDCCLRLSFARANLFVVEHGNDVARIDRVAFAHFDIEYSTTQLRGDSGRVAFDPATQLDHVRWNSRAGEKQSPDQVNGDT